ncbi:hypothetical protein BH09BAC2_BH09BAC2_00120 [soil metagenome]
MKTLLTLLIFIYSANSTVKAQLRVDWQIQGYGNQPNVYYLPSPGTYTLEDISTNFCATSKISWKSYPAKGVSFSAPNTYASSSTVTFATPGSYSINHTVSTYSAPGWTCGTATETKTTTVIIKALPKKKK